MLKSLSVASILELNLRTPKIKFMKHVSDVFISSWDRDDETIKSLWSSFSSVYRYASEVNDEFISIFALNSFRQFLMTVFLLNYSVFLKGIFKKASTKYKLYVLIRIMIFVLRFSYIYIYEIRILLYEYGI